MRSRPDPSRRRAELPAIAGQPPGLDVTITGCVFRSRCPLAVDACAETPPWTATGADTGFACIRPLSAAVRTEVSDVA
nr:oligopeptide/dipeptide ABC transporter ATP-binding protein [Leifsonia aquatica]